MRALTLTQPWAGLVAAGAKLVENRSRSLIRRDDFGTRFAVHASREIDDEAFAAIYRIAPELRARTAEVRAKSRWHQLAGITGAVLAVATIERAVRLDRNHAPATVVSDLHTRDVVDLGPQGRWFVGPIGYVLHDVRALAEPVPCTGRQGFWSLPRDVETRVVQQLARAA